MKIKLLEVNKPNKNNRIYPRNVMEKAMEKYKKDFIDEKRAFVVKQLPIDTMVNLIDVVGLVKEIYIEDLNNVLMVEVEKLNVNGFNEVWKLLEEGKIFIRTSGIGSIDKQPDGTYIIGNDYELVCLFFTDDPA